MTDVQSKGSAREVLPHDVLSSTEQATRAGEQDMRMCVSYTVLQGDDKQIRRRTVEVEDEGAMRNNMENRVFVLSGLPQCATVGVLKA